MHVALNGALGHIVASGCQPEDADALAARLAADYRGLDLGFVTGDPGFRLSASIAVAAWPSDGADLHDLVDQAYGLMTRAWKDGGDRIYRLKPDEKRDSPEARR